MPKHRKSKKKSKEAQEAKFKEIQKKAKEFFANQTPDDQKSLFDRLGNQDGKVREMAYITLSTIDISPNKGLTTEIFSTEMTSRVVQALNDPILKNSLCVFAAISNVLNSADLHNQGNVLSDYLQAKLLDIICERTISIAKNLTENWEKLHNNDVEKNLLFIENAYKLLDTIVLLEGICIEENLEAISTHENLMEMTINLMVGKECEYLNPAKSWMNESILYWVTRFMYSLTKENHPLCDKLSGIEDLGNYISATLSELNERNVHVCANLSGISYNFCSQNFLKQLSECEPYVKFVHVPLTKILVGMNSPQVEFQESFANNLSHIKEAVSSQNEDEETIMDENKPSTAKLAQMMSDFLNEMSGQVRNWKNYALGSVNSLETLSQILAELGPYDEDSPFNDWIMTTFNSKLSGASRETTLFEQVLERTRPVEMKLKISLEEMHGIGGVVNDVQTAACEVLINLLIACPPMFDFDNSQGTITEEQEILVKAPSTLILTSLKHQKFSNKLVEAGLRFLGLYSKNFPDILRTVMEENKACESFLELAESVRDPETIAHALSILSAVFSGIPQTPEENLRVCKILMHHMNSPNLRVICESLNAMFDIYSEENYDKVLESEKVIPTLEKGLPALHEKVKSDSNEFEDEELEFFQEILHNLEQFIKYKHENM